MRVRRAVALFGAATLVCGCFLLYLVMDLSIPLRALSSPDIQDNKWLHFESRLRSLENNLNKHHETVGEMKKVINQLMPGISSTTSTGNRIISSSNKQTDYRNVTPAFEMEFDRMCPIQVDYVPKTNIQMLEVYKELKFDNPDGGVWKQGWNINYDVHQWNNEHKLKVFVIPHSHNDPGWLKTFEEYYISQTKNILNNMVPKLMDDRSRKFIWAEISYFAMWWEEIDQTTRTLVKSLIKNGQLEIVTGGWVMNDEANAHWISIYHQMNEGHQWLHRNLNITPKSSWAIDPFGQSPIMPMLLKKMGLENLLIQRIHYSVKKFLARQTQLEFRWKQLWDGTGKTGLFTHMMPFYSYDVPHTCGPDPKICCQFDFKRLPGYGVTCPWRVAPQAITDTNVAHRAELLLDQYRKKSQLYRTNVVLAPLGDDFRYDHPTEWNNQYNNYQKLFDYMNSNSKLNVEAQFGTLTDYFDAVRAEKSVEDFPTLTGDFFTYADRDDHYWSGYFTSRPFYKRMDRVLMAYIRSADIILTMAYGSKREGANLVLADESGLTKLLTDARLSFALFQHHDGVAGTARDHVMIDYGQKMLSAILNAQHVIQHAVNVLLSGPNSDILPSETMHYNIDDTRRSQDSLAERYVITIGKGAPIKRIVVYNSLTFTRHEVIMLLVSTPYVQVTDLTGNIVHCQISPVFQYGTSMSGSRYELAFIANVPALSLVTYTVQALEKQESTMETVMSSIRVFNHYDDLKFPNAFTDVEVSPSAREFTIQNKRVTAAFNNLGLLKAIRVGVNTLPVHLDFAKYGVRQSSERSGAYLFLPDGDAQPLNIESTIVKVIEGPVYSSVIVQLPKVHHVVTLFNTPGPDSLGLEIINTVDISETSNFELVMRLSTNINSTSEFFTDLNGYQLIRRKRFPKLPIQANYYPMPSMAYIEDKNTRLSVLSSTALGSSSMREGQLEVMLDRRLKQDDNRGMGQGVTDNHPTRHIFRVLLEKRTHRCQTTAENHPSGFPTISSHVASQSLLNPLIKLHRNDDSDMVSARGYTAIANDIGVDITVPFMQPGIMINKHVNNIGLTIHRQNLDTCYSDRLLLQQFPLSHGSIKVSDVLPFVSKAKKSSLTFLHVGATIDPKESQEICPMDLLSFLVDR